MRPSQPVLDQQFSKVSILDLDERIEARQPASSSCILPTCCHGKGILQLVRGKLSSGFPVFRKFSWRNSEVLLLFLNSGSLNFVFFANIYFWSIDKVQTKHEFCPATGDVEVVPIMVFVGQE